MNNDIEKTLEVLHAATQGIRAAYVARYTELQLAALLRDREGLAAVGMDANIYATFPRGTTGKAEYRQAESKYQRVRSYFKGVKCCRTMHEPEIVEERPDSEPRLRAAAKQEADALVDSYLYKMAGKIGKLATAATTNGNIWDCATLTVTCADGEVQTWHTNCILNQSIYGKLFNQWPTRRTA
jgi:hypothetical protein